MSCAKYIKQSQYTDIFLLTEVTGQGLGERIPLPGDASFTRFMPDTQGQGNKDIVTGAELRTMCEKAQRGLDLNILKSTTSHYSNNANLDVKSVILFSKTHSTDSYYLGLKSGYSF